MPTVPADRDDPSASPVSPESAASPARSERLPASTIDEALRLHMAGEIEQALALYEAILAESPDDANVMQLSGLCLIQMGQAERAAERLRASLGIDPHQPSVHVKLGMALKVLGQFDDALDCFDRALAADPRHFDAWMERGIVLVMLERPREALGCFDHAIAVVPTNVGALSNRGDTLRRLSRYEEAFACFDHALAIDPLNIDVLLNRSVTLRETRRNAESLECLQRILSIDPVNVPALNNRGNALVNLRRHEQAVQSFERVLKLDPVFVPAWINLANVLTTLGRHDEARAASDHAISLAPHSPAAHWNAALLDLRAGRFDTGWQRYEVRWKMAKFSTRRYQHLPTWLGKEDLRGKRIVLWQEQGLGDTLQFCRYAIMVAALGATVVLEVQASLKSLIAYSFQGIAHVITAHERAPECDYATPFMSLPLAFSTTANSIPFAPSYLKADPARVSQWRDTLGARTRKLRVGLAYTGNPRHRGDLDRSIDLGALASLERYAELIVVQKDARPGDQPTLAAHPAIRHFGPMLTDFSDTAALVANLDLVISVDTSLSHLAGALGKPVWVLLPAHGDWRWLRDRDDSPWYPTARLFRQRTNGDWDDVVQRVEQALEEMGAIESRGTSRMQTAAGDTSAPHTDSPGDRI